MDELCPCSATRSSLLSSVRHLVKRLVFGPGPKPHNILFGTGRGSKFVIDPASKAQRILGLDEAEIAGTFRDAVKRARTFIDVGASDGYYPILALRMNPSVEAIGCEMHAPLEMQARENYRLNFPSENRSFTWIAKPVGTAEGQVTLDELSDSHPGPIFIKIDVDGVGIEVLKSGERLLSREDSAFLVETHSAELERDVIAMLEAAGFRCRIIKNAWWRMILPETRPIELNRWVFAQK